MSLSPRATPDQFPYRPVLDGDFLPTVPVEAVRAGAARNIRAMIGHTRDEYRTFLSAAEADKPITQKMLLHHAIKELPPIVQCVPRGVSSHLLGEIGCCGSWARNSSVCQLSGWRRHWPHREQRSITTIYDTRSRVAVSAPIVLMASTSRSYSNTSIPRFARNTFGLRSEDHYMAQLVHAAWVSFIKSGQINGALSGWPFYDLQQRKAMMIDREPLVLMDAERPERLIWTSAK